MTTPKNILWYIFHPDLSQSQGNKLIQSIVQDLPNLTMVDAYAEYPDFKIDAKKEQDRLVANDLIVFQFPMYWYSTPALFKEWQDKVLDYGFAYPPKEGKALHGKHWINIITTGAFQASFQSGGYNNFTISELYRPLHQTATLAGMRYHPPLTMHSVLPEDSEWGGSSTQTLTDRANEIRQHIADLDLDERHSIESLGTPYMFNAL